jgi:hypothetical protein
VHGRDQTDDAAYRAHAEPFVHAFVAADKRARYLALLAAGRLVPTKRKHWADGWGRGINYHLDERFVRRLDWEDFTERAEQLLRAAGAPATAVGLIGLHGFAMSIRPPGEFLAEISDDLASQDWAFSCIPGQLAFIGDHEGWTAILHRTTTNPAGPAGRR